MPANRHCSPPWSWESGPSVDPPAFDAGSASAEHGPAQVPRPPAKWHTLCPPLSILFRHGAVSRAAYTRPPWGRVHTWHRSYFLRWLLKPALLRNALQPSEPAIRWPAFWRYSVKKGMLRTAPQRPFFQKWSRAAVRTYPVMYVSRLSSPDRAVVPGHEKTTLRRTESVV